MWKAYLIITRLFFRIINNSRREDWEVGFFFVFVSISDIELEPFTLIEEGIGSWPM